MYSKVNKYQLVKTMYTNYLYITSDMINKNSIGKEREWDNYQFVK